MTTVVLPPPDLTPLEDPAEAPHRRPARAGMPAFPAVAVWAALTCGLLCAWLLAYALGVSALQEGRSQQQLYGQLRDELSQGNTPIGGDGIAVGTPVALLEVPSIHLRQVVVEGTSAGTLRAGPGHRRNTVLPGQPGTAVIYGRSATFGAPFRAITALKPGDTVTVTTGQGPFTYEVSAVRRANDPLPVPPQRGGSRLTLATAEGDGWRAGWAPDHVVYVDATLKGDSQLGPPGRPSTVATAEQAMQSDPDAFVPLVLWLQLLASAAAAVVVARLRWGGAQAWFVGVPVILACLWGFAGSMAQLLPNLV